MTAPSSPLVALVAAWLSATVGAQQHWAFVAPQRPTVPAVRAGWARNEVDRFVQAAREARGLTAAAEAPRAMWLRRVTFDLTGLPPTPAQLEAFEADPHPAAHERVVDALLASPAAAEESARWWLDLSRYADTHGMQRDQVRALWRWRDWVIDAYAANLPYDRFVTEQLAGDLLPDATLPQRIASGWLRNNPTSDEGGLIPEEYLARYAMNRTDTFGTTMLGLTVGCAQCHDHKSDPLSTRDYYRLFAYFASFDEQGNDGGALAPEPAVLAPLPEQLPEYERLRGAAAAAAADCAAVGWQRIPFASNGGEPVEQRPEDGSWLATGTVPKRGDYVLSAPGDFAGIRALRVTALPDGSLPERGPGRADNGNFVLTEVELHLDGERVPIAAAAADFAQSGHDAAAAIDGDPRSGWAVQGRHEPIALHLVLTAPLPGGPRHLQLVLRHQSEHAHHLLGRFAVHGSTVDVGARWSARRVAEQALSAFEASQPRCMVSRDLPVPRTVRVLARGRYDQPGEQVVPGTPSFLPPLPDQAPPDRRALASWLFAADQPLTARVAANRIWLRHFGRGLVATPHDFGVQGARPSHPELLDWLARELVASGWNERALHRLLVTSATYRQSSVADATMRRRDPDNVWLARMSRVRLPAEAIRDQALAVAGQLELQRGGASVKIQQPPGIWEPVAFAGSNTEHYVADQGPALRRRSLYTFWKRSAPPPLLVTFDAPSRETCVVERQVTNTPLQALALWNDEGLVAAAHGFAERCRHAAGLDESVTGAFLQLLQRRPNERELHTCRELLASLSTAAEPGEAAWRTAWFVLASTLLSLDEALHRN